MVYITPLSVPQAMCIAGAIYKLIEGAKETVPKVITEMLKEHADWLSDEIAEAAAAAGEDISDYIPYHTDA